MQAELTGNQCKHFLSFNAESFLCVHKLENTDHSSIQQSGQIAALQKSDTVFSCDLSTTDSSPQLLCKASCFFKSERFPHLKVFLLPLALYRATTSIGSHVCCLSLQAPRLLQMTLDHVGLLNEQQSFFLFKFTRASVKHGTLLVHCILQPKVMLFRANVFS